MKSKEALKKFLTDTIGDIKAAQVAQRFYASGKSAKTLKAVVVSKLAGHILGSEAIFYQIYGRKPGKMPPVDEIENWIKKKRLDISPWAVAKTIAEKGTAVWRKERKGLNISLREQLRLKQLSANLEGDYLVEIDSLFNNINK